MNNFIDLKVLVSGIEQDSPFGKYFNSIGYKVVNFEEKNDNTIFIIDVFQKLNYKPDLILLFYPEKNIIPFDIGIIDIPCIAILNELDSNFLLLKENLKRFDLIITNQDNSNFLNNYGLQNTLLWNDLFLNFNFIKTNIENVKKEYDICIIKGINEEFDIKKDQIIYKLLSLQKKYKIKIVSNTKKEEISSNFLQARIVLNFGNNISENEITFQSPLNNSLLLNFSDNSISFNNLFGLDNDIEFNFDNLEEMLDFYLKNDDVRVEISNKQKNKISNFSVDESLSNLLNEINKIEFNSNNKCTNEEIDFLNSISILMFPSNINFQKAMEIVKNLLNKYPDNMNYLNLLGELYCLIFIYSNKENLVFINKSFKIFQKLIRFESKNLIFQNNFINSLLFDNKVRIAKKKLISTIENLENDDFSYNVDYYSLIPNSSTELFLEFQKLNKLYWNNKEKLNNSIKKIFLREFYKKLGDIYYSENDLENSKKYYILASEIYPDLGYIIYDKLFEISQKNNNIKDSIRYCLSIITSLSLNLELRKELGEIYYNSGEFDNALKVIEESLDIIHYIPDYQINFDSFNLLLEEVLYNFSQQNKFKNEKELLSNKPLNNKYKILTFCWHVPYVFMMSKTKDNYEVYNNIQRSDGSMGWIIEQRPIPSNIRLISDIDEVKKKLECGYYDLCVCHSLDDIEFVSSYNIPSIFLAHNSLTVNSLNSNREKIRDKVLNFLENRKSLFVTISEMKIHDWDIKGKIIYPGIDLNEYKDYKGEIKSLITVGNYLKERNEMFDFKIIDYLIKNYRNRIVGYNPSIKNSRASLNWDELKFIYQYYKLYLNVAIEPEEGVNLSLLEAMATGMPIISYYNKISPIENEINGFISNDKDYLRKKIDLLFRDSKLALEIGKNARKTVEEKYSIDKFVENWKEAFNLCLGKSEQDLIKENKQSLNIKLSNLEIKTDKEKKLNIVLASKFYPAGIVNYFEKSLKKFCNVITCGPSMNEEGFKDFNEQIKMHDLKKDNDSFIELMRRLVKKTNIPIETGNISVNEIIKSLPEEFKPDLFLWIDCHQTFLPMDINSLECTSACMLIDTHSPGNFDWRIEYAKDFDYIFVVHNQHVNEVAFRTKKPTEWLTVACDPEIHLKINSQKAYDITFIGQTYRNWHFERVRLLEKLINKGFDLHIDTKILEDMALDFSRSKIVFNKSMNGDLNMRVFEALSTGSMLLTDKLPEHSNLEKLFENKKHLVLYEEENLIELAKYYLDHPIEREKIAQQGREEVLKYHTYDHRVKQIIKTTLNIDL